MEEPSWSPSTFPNLNLSSIFPQYIIITILQIHNFLTTGSTMAELSQVFGFLIIFKDSLKLILKNGKFMAQITLLSLLLPSILLVLFFYIYQTLANYATETLEYSTIPIIAYFTLLLLFEFTFIFAYAKISQISGIVTIIVSAASCTHTTISSQDLYSRIKTTTHKSKLFGSRTTSNRGTLILVMVVWMVVISLAIFHPNPITISIAVVVGVLVFVYSLYSSVPAMLSHVVSIVEEKFEGSEALEKAEDLIVGQRQHGFMINLCLNMVVLILFAGFWLVLRGDQLWSVNVMEFGLVFVNVLGLAMIFVRVAYTVLYFRCKELYRRSDGGGVGSFDYSKLSASDLGGDNIP